MANRRKFLAGIGALASGSAAAVGTGAFTSTATSRDVSVSVAGDQSAYLTFEAGDSPHASISNGQLTLDFDGNKVSGSGLNTGAWTKFNDLFTIRNESGSPIAVWLDEGNPSAPNVNNGIDGNFASNVGIDADKILWSFTRDSQPQYYANSDVGHKRYDSTVPRPSAAEGRTTDTIGNTLEAGVDDYTVLAPTNIDPDKNQSIFNRVGQHPAVLAGGDSVSISLQFNIQGFGNNSDPDPSTITDATGQVVVNGFSHDFATDLQS